MSRVSGLLVDSDGRETVIIVDKKQDSGKYQLALTAGLSNATYLVRLVVNGEQASRNLIVLN